MNEKLLTMLEAAEFLELSYSSVAKMVMTGKLRRIKIGKLNYFKIQDLQNLKQLR